MSVINLAAERTRRALTESEKYAEASASQNEPAWKDDIHTCCAHARMVRAEHDAESARIRFEMAQRGLDHWNKADDLERRIDANNLEWDRYICLLARLAGLPATTRGEARNKRDAIGKMWLTPGGLAEDPQPGTLGERFAAMRIGCLRDDHLFPPSMRLARASTGE